MRGEREEKSFSEFKFKATETWRNDENTRQWAIDKAKFLLFTSEDELWNEFPRGVLILECDVICSFTMQLGTAYE